MERAVLDYEISSENIISSLILLCWNWNIQWEIDPYNDF